VGRFHAYVVSALVLAAMASPALRGPHDDSYPLSTYPMFAHRRGRENDVTRAVAIHADASEAAVPPRYVANAETMQAFYTLARAVEAGDAASAELCETIAARLPAAREPELSSAVRLELVTERVDAIDYLAGRARPFDRRVHASCEVPRAENKVKP
jgi:hypothetical protein